MKGFLRTAAVMAVGLLSAATAQDDEPAIPTQSPDTGLKLRSFTALGCFSDPGSMWDMGPYLYQTTGWCQPLCVRQAATYFALVNGTNCFCGDSAPDSSEKVDSSECDTSCNGFGAADCGGTNRWAIYADGFRNGDPTGSIQITTPTQTWFGHVATQSSTLQSTVIGSNHQPSTIIITQSGAPSPTTTNSAAAPPGPNKGAIAAGVVVGIVGLIALLAALVFYLRTRKRRELEEERRRHESVMNVVTKGEKPPSAYSTSDSRLEPSVMFQRRQSDGSIMDNEDYSRRILKITNPDDR